MNLRSGSETWDYAPELAMLSAYAIAFLGMLLWHAVFPPPPVTDHSFTVTFSNVPQTVCRTLARSLPSGGEATAADGGTPCIEPGNTTLSVRFP